MTQEEYTKMLAAAKYRRGLPPSGAQDYEDKGVFPNNDALYKLVYLAYRNIRKKWLCHWQAGGRQRNNWPLNLEIPSRLCNFALPRAPRRRNTIENRVPPTEVNA